MAKSKPRRRAKPAALASELPTVRPSAPKVTRADTFIALMRASGGATAAELGASVGWQVHSVRGFIAGTLKKRADLTVTVIREDGVTHYRVVEAEVAGQ